MGIKKASHIEIEVGAANFKSLTNKLTPLILPYFDFTGKIDLSKNDPTFQIAAYLAALVDSKIVIEDNERSKYFCADDILARQVIIDKGLMKFWGVIYWLATPHDYEINKTEKDPFYAEFRLDNNKLLIKKMKFGDYEKTNLDRCWWYDLELDWIYDFEE